MTTNVPGTRPAPPSTEPVVAESMSTSTPVTNPTGVGGVAVYDRGPDGSSNPSERSSVSKLDSPIPAKGPSAGTIVAWVIGIVVLIILAYYLLQIIF